MAVSGAIIDYTGGAGERNFTVFIQLTFSGSFTTGGDPLNLATLSNPNGLDVEGVFELPLTLGPRGLPGRYRRVLCPAEDHRLYVECSSHQRVCSRRSDRFRSLQLGSDRWKRDTHHAEAPRLKPAMNFDGFVPHEFTRFGGLVDNDDPTVLPMGVAAVCKNCRFQLTTVATRYGLQTALQGPNQAAISGLASLIYTPENPGETLFQVPLVFDTDGYLLVERPAGSGMLVRVQGPLVSQPANSHAIVTEAYNRALIAYSDLKTPQAPDQRLRVEHAAAGPVRAEAARRIVACVNGLRGRRVCTTHRERAATDTSTDAPSRALRTPPSRRGRSQKMLLLQMAA